jgi:hypothetical protein
MDHWGIEIDWLSQRVIGRIGDECVVVQGKCQGLLFSDYVSIARVTSSCISAWPFVAVGAVDDDIAIRSWFSLSVAGGVVV